MKTSYLFLSILAFVLNLQAQSWITKNPDGSTTYNIAQRLRELSVAEKETLIVASDSKLVDEVLKRFKDPIRLLTMSSDCGLIIISTTICVRGDVFEVSGRKIISVVDYVMRADGMRMHWVFDVNKDMVPDCEVYFTFHRNKSISDSYEYVLDEAHQSRSVMSDDMFRKYSPNLKQFVK